ncbi:MAG: LamG-like jellyroll fold domain-containing protein [Chthoniobacter sp.]
MVSVESTDVHGFDSIVFAEKEPRRWLAGSNFGIRSQNVGGAEETAKAGELIHLAIVYGADNSIAIYRNGAPYGQSYSKAELKKFEAGKSRILLGLRHMGAGSGFFSGEIEEARLYDRALTAEEVAASFHAGAVPSITPAEVVAALSPEQRTQRAALVAEIEKLRAEASANPSTEAWAQALTDAATNQANPLHLWAKLENVRDADLPAAWQKLTEPLRTRLDEARKTNRENSKAVWNLAGADYAQWFPYGPGLTPQPLPAGEFSIESEGDRVLDGLAPGGALTDRLSDKHTGILTSPRFKIDTDSISVRAFGTGGAMVRVIVDNYPLPSNPIFPKAILEKSEPGWVRLDTAYRKGSYAYLEFATREDLTRPLQEKKDKAKTKVDSDEPSSFGVEQIVFHDSKDVPAEENSALSPLLDSPAPKSATELAQLYGRVIAEAVTAWRHDQLTEPQRMLLDALVHRGVLPATLAELETARPLVAEYRQLEAGVTAVAPCAGRPRNRRLRRAPVAAWRSSQAG